MYCKKQFSESKDLVKIESVKNSQRLSLFYIKEKMIQLGANGS